MHDRIVKMITEHYMFSDDDQWDSFGFHIGSKLYTTRLPPSAFRRLIHKIMEGYYADTQDSDS